MRTNYNAVGKLEIADRRALTQKLGIRGDGNIGRWVCFANKSFYFVACPDWHSDFVMTTVKPFTAAAISRDAAYT